MGSHLLPAAPRAVDAAIAVWRRLKKLGALPIGDGVAALPHDDRTREQLDWLASDVEQNGGEAVVWIAEPASKRERRALETKLPWRSAPTTAASQRMPTPETAGARLHDGARFGGSTAVRRDPRSRLSGLARAPPRGGIARAAEQARGGRAVKWATRPRCHVDRTACAWLIRRFIDDKAEFIFVEDVDDVPEGATPFDMRGVELGHVDGDCSFERLLLTYELEEPGLRSLAASSTRPTSATSDTTRRRPSASTSRSRRSPSAAPTPSSSRRARCSTTACSTFSRSARSSFRRVGTDRHRVFRVR